MTAPAHVDQQLFPVKNSNKIYIKDRRSLAIAEVHVDFSFYVQSVSVSRK